MNVNAPPTTEFSPLDVSDFGLAELRTRALDVANAASRFGCWLHCWADEEQARRATGSLERTARHACCLPLMNTWSDVEAAEALEAVSVLVHGLADWTASQFAERLQLAVAYECAHRLRKGSENAS